MFKGKTKRRKKMNDKMLWDNIDDLRLISQKLQEQITLLTSKVEEIEERISELEQQSEANLKGEEDE